MTENMTDLVVKVLLAELEARTPVTEFRENVNESLIREFMACQGNLVEEAVRKSTVNGELQVFALTKRLLDPLARHGRLRIAFDPSYD